jgi:hypothetical protein
VGLNEDLHLGSRKGDFIGRIGNTLRLPLPQEATIKRTVETELGVRDSSPSELLPLD